MLENRKRAEANKTAREQGEEGREAGKGGGG